MTGDLGNPSPSTKVCKQIAILQPNLTIHLGDVYYAGSDDEEQHILVKSWPPGSAGSLALNSNQKCIQAAVRILTQWVAHHS